MRVASLRHKRSIMLESLFLTLANIMPRHRYGIQARVRLLRLAGLKLAPQIVINGPMRIIPRGAGKLIRMGKRSYLGTDASFGGRGGVTIGEFVQIGPRASFQTASHTIDFETGKARPTITAPIVIEDHVWIGAGVTILQGVTIGRGSVVAAGALVTKDVTPMKVVGGVPAREIRDVQEHPEGSGLLEG